MPELVGGVFVVVAIALFIGVRRSRLSRIQGDVVFVVFLVAFVVLLYLVSGST